MITKRMPAVRMFSNEFNESTVSYEEKINGMTVSKLLSPLGIKFGRVFVVGTLLEVAVAREEPRILRARISDPIGAFTVYASAYQPQALAVLSEIEPPSFVAVIAKPKVLNRPFLRPEYVTAVEASTFDRWVDETIQHTLRRIEAFEKQESEDAKEAKAVYKTDVEKFREAIGYIRGESREEKEEFEFDLDKDFNLEGYIKGS